MELQTISESKCFGGSQRVYAHDSEACGCKMTFALYLPPEVSSKTPVLWYLSGLTCTHENAMVKAGMQRAASEHGIALVFPDTSPRGEDVPDSESYDLGQGAGFYVNATQEPWSRHYRMWDYVAEELPGLLFQKFVLDSGRQGISGHSMGGHGALTLAMGLPGRFRSVSALSPIAHPTASEWGRKQLSAYLGPDEAQWARHDATLLMRERGFGGPMLIDTGTADDFLKLLMPEELMRAMEERGQEGEYRMREGYDHSYFFVSTFAGEHVEFHARALDQ